MHEMYARHFKPHGHRPFCVRIQHEFGRRFVRPEDLLSLQDILILQSHSARYCPQTYGNLPYRLMCDQLSLDTVCDRAVRPCNGPRVLVRPHWHRLQAMFCARDALAHARTLLRSIVLLQQACLAAPHHHELPKDGESTPRRHPRPTPGAQCSPRLPTPRRRQQRGGGAAAACRRRPAPPPPRGRRRRHAARSLRSTSSPLQRTFVSTT